MYTKSRLLLAAMLMAAAASVATAQVEKAAARANRSL
jgi:hypothetical protein